MVLDAVWINNRMAKRVCNSATSRFEKVLADAMALCKDLLKTFDRIGMRNVLPIAIDPVLLIPSVFEADVDHLKIREKAVCNIRTLERQTFSV